MAWLEAHQSLSGWAQAVGALITLWVGVHIAGSRQKTIAKAHALNARAIIRDAIEACVAISNRTQMGRVGNFDRLIKGLNAKEDALLAFPIHELPPRAIERFYEFRKSIREFSRVAKKQLAASAIHISETQKVTVQFHFKIVYEEWNALAKSLGIKKSKSGLEKKRERDLSRAYDKAMERDFAAFAAALEHEADDDPDMEKSGPPI